MSLPGNVTPITVTESYVSATGAIATGHVIFRPSAVLRDSASGVTIMDGPVRADLTSGAISIILPANDDPELSPTGTTYEVIENINGATGTPFNISLPESAPGGALTLSSIAPTSAGVGVGTSYRLLTEHVNVVSAAGSTETIPSYASYGVSDITLDANCTFTFPTPVAGAHFILIARQDSTGSRTVTWPASVAWPGATAPTLTTTASRYDMFEFVGTSGTKWAGRTLGLNYT